MTGPDDVDLLRRALASHVRGDAPSTRDCLDDETLAALAEGTLDAESRATALPHLSACMRCRNQVASLARALDDPNVAREVRAVESVRRRRLHRTGRVAAGVAAAAALLLFAWPPLFEESVRHRAPPTTEAPAPEAVWPVGPVADVSSLRWTTVTGADRYRITLFDAEGDVLYEGVLADTVAVLPDSALPGPGETSWWQVEARIGFDRWVASDLIEFSIMRGPRR